MVEFLTGLAIIVGILLLPVVFWFAGWWCVKVAEFLEEWIGE